MIRLLVILCSLWLIWLIISWNCKKFQDTTAETCEPDGGNQEGTNQYHKSTREQLCDLVKSCGRASTSAHSLFFFFSILCILSPVKNGSLHEFTLQGYWQNVRGENQNISKSLYSLDTVNCVFMEENLCDIVWEQLCQMWEPCPCSEVDAWSTPIYFFLPLIFIVLSFAASDRSNKSAFKSCSRLNYKMFKTL